MKEEIKVLKSKILDDLQSIKKIYDKLKGEKEKIKNTPNEAQLINMGYYLHNLYNAFENIFLNIADVFENQVKERARWHYSLQKRMSLDIEGIRPKIISKEASNYLDELRRFRHIFRHSYDYEMDWERLKIVLRKAEKLQNIYEKEIGEFIKFLDKLSE
jgi:hypothetical protein